MGKLVKFNVVDGTGAAAAGQTVIAGTTELKTGTSGIVQAVVLGLEDVVGPSDAAVPWQTNHRRKSTLSAIGSTGALAALRA